MVPKANDEARFNEWLTAIYYENLEFTYRYIYDAYLVVKTLQDGLYFQLEKTTDGDQTGYVLKDRFADLEPLVLPSEEARQDFIEVMLTRYCPQDRDMSAWHSRRHEARGEDLRNWVDPSEPEAHNDK